MRQLINNSVRFKFILVVLNLILIKESYACDACNKMQPKLTRGITHGTGPDSYLDWLWISIVFAIAIYALVKSVKYLFKPNEVQSDHIKYLILDERN